jgi:hypothetical protein
MQFSIYNAVSGGTQIGTTITNNSVAVANGVFTVSLDFSPAAPFAAGANRWIEIAVKKPADPLYTTLTPRQQITSNPFSIKALSSNSADVLSPACVLCVTDVQIAAISGGKVTGTVANAANASVAGNISGVVAIANGGTGSAGGNASGLTNITPANISPGTAPINIIGVAANPLTVTTGATPAIANRTLLSLNYAASESITDLSGGVEGQCVVLLTVNPNVTIDDSGNFNLAGNWQPLGNDTLTVCRSSVSGVGAWYETARSSVLSFSFPILTVTKMGTGTGTLTSSPSGINCGADCTEAYAPGAVVTLTAVPSAGSANGTWSGCDSETSNTCTVTMNASRSVSIRFVPSI